MAEIIKGWLLLWLCVSTLTGCALTEKWQSPQPPAYPAPTLSEADRHHLEGLRLTTGEGGSVDHGAAARAFHRAAEQGHPAAQHMLGMSYYVGRGVSQDYSQALVWLEKAAYQGHAGAQYFVGDIYLNGRGLAPEVAWGVHWFGRSAAKGYRRAQLSLGVAYVGGMGVERDLVDAWLWLTLAAQQQAEGARSLLDRLKPRLSAGDRGAAEQRAQAWRAEQSEPAPHPALVRFLQHALNEAGFSAGDVDGKIGPRTRQAIAGYRASRGLAPGTLITRKLVTRVRQEVKKSTA